MTTTIESGDGESRKQKVRALRAFRFRVSSSGPVVMEIAEPEDVVEVFAADCVAILATLRAERVDAATPLMRRKDRRRDRAGSQ